MGTSRKLAGALALSVSLLAAAGRSAEELAPPPAPSAREPLEAPDWWARGIRTHAVGVAPPSGAIRTHRFTENPGASAIVVHGLRRPPERERIPTRAIARSFRPERIRTHRFHEPQRSSRIRMHRFDERRP
jgi:hypothetical protein